MPSSFKLPPLPILRHAYATAVGFAAGSTAGLVGWGAAQLIIPAMIHPNALASYSQLSATGISLSALSVSSISSGYKFWTDDQVNVPIALCIGLPAVFSARVGSHIAKRLSGNALELVFNGFSLVLIPTHFWIQQRRSTDGAATATDACSSLEKAKEMENRPDTDGCEFSTPQRAGVLHSEKESANSTSIIDSTTSFERQITNTLSNPLIMQHASFGFFSGILSALMGVGGLPITMSYLTVSCRELRQHEIQGTAVVALMPSILTSAASRMSVIPPTATACVAAGSFCGGLAGARIALSLSEEQLRYAFMGSLVLFGGLSMRGAVRNITQIYSKM